MSETIFILVVGFVGYVAYTVLTDKSGVDSGVYQTESAVTESESEVTDSSVQAVANVSLSDELKNPLTGEVSKIPNNYRFGKRWIKEALVAEGLLTQVYKNNELNDAINEQVQVAMATLKTMDKYKV